MKNIISKGYGGGGQFFIISRGWGYLDISRDRAVKSGEEIRDRKARIKSFAYDLAFKWFRNFARRLVILPTPCRNQSPLASPKKLYI